ncbi:MAG: aminotransferase class V-fold PLP-dependent enzyme [Chthoniobacter sp.]|uniref:aminotransferase class V-fold PLP-dependent enzyme n=1 Tax=Chthoniobacter sp. TaxID=2510640 RepID=UPI0032A6F4E5
MPSPLVEHWTLDPSVVFLNHGSFGACPRAVLEAQTEWRARMERQPVQFLWRDLPDLLDAAREKLADFLKADPDDLVFVANATAGVNAVVRSLHLSPGDELLTTDHDYNACRNVLAEAATRAGAKVVVAKVPFPLRDETQIIEAILSAVTPRTRLAMIDHITSPTALVFPITKIIRALEAHGIDTLVDGAHAPGAVPLHLGLLRPAYYTGNLHKWVCAPKGAAFLWARPDRQDALRPAIVSHGENTRRPGRSPFHDRFDWPGTLDPTAWLSVPAAIQWGGSLFPGGWEELRDRNRHLASSARALLAGRLNQTLPCPNELLASMATLLLPTALQQPPLDAGRFDPIQVRLHAEHGVEAPVVRWGEPKRRYVRFSAQAYNCTEDYRTLGEAILRLSNGQHPR